MDLELDRIRLERGPGFTLAIPALRIRGGRVTAILGPNGSGKTTLLRLIAGLDRPGEGAIRFGDGVSGRRPPVGYVFQEQVFVRDSVRANLELGLRIRGVAAAERRQRAEQAAALVGVADLLDRPAARLSGGEGRRVSLARALCLRSPVVLLDEPLAGLDQRTYSRLLDELPQLLAAFDATTLLVTHDREEALRLAEDVIVLVGGRVHAAGDKRDVVRQPRTAAVAEVLGYLVLEAGGRMVAVPADALQPGAGQLPFTMVIDDVVDLVDSREAIGRIGDVGVRVAWPDGIEPPSRGSVVAVHAGRFYDLDSSG
jgi:ABC-type sulfate/molybdate transport systems ATPase subunit